MAPIKLHNARLKFDSSWVCQCGFSLAAHSPWTCITSLLTPDKLFTTFRIHQLYFQLKGGGKLKTKESTLTLVQEDAEHFLRMVRFNEKIYKNIFWAQTFLTWAYPAYASSRDLWLLRYLIRVMRIHCKRVFSPVMQSLSMAAQLVTDRLCKWTFAPNLQYRIKTFLLQDYHHSMHCIPRPLHFIFLAVQDISRKKVVVTYLCPIGKKNNF